MPDAAPDIAAQAEVIDAVAPPDTGLRAALCPGGADCPCADSADCDQGICLDTPQGRQCARLCSGSCPAGFKRVAVSAAVGGDGSAQACVANAGSQCEPCTQSKQCTALLATTGALCVDYGGANGRFCGLACTGDADCPAGSACQNATSTEGLKAKQCKRLPDSAGAIACPCSPRAVNLGLATSCAFTAKSGPCAGVRQCSTAGLSDCSASPNSVELCDDQDNNCNGLTDEGLCNDGNPCTTDGCVQGGTTCNHADAATGTKCDDGNACTAQDGCNGGACSGGISICQCSNAPDCKAFEDGDLCNGTLYCDDAQKCTVNPATLVTCPSAQDSACAKNACQPGTGICAMVAVSDKTACELVCDDKIACTADSCDQNAGCVFTGNANLCDDSQTCTVDSCDGVKGCLHVNLAATATCTDGSVCTIGDQCGGGVCAPGAAKTCDDGDGCTTDTCDAVVDCKFFANTLACNDGDACTSGDKCSAGKCGGAAMACDDSDTCTVDSCNSVSGCVHTTTGSCGDGACCGDDGPANCPTDCGFLLKRLGAACTTPGGSDTCTDGYFCVARGAGGGGNVCVADFETWAPIHDSHPATDFSEFTDYVKDDKTGLLWAKESLAPVTWTAALTACAAKTYGGFNDWRLPTRAELFSLADRSKANPAWSAPNLVIPTDVWYYWCAVPWASGGSAWFVNFNYGYAYFVDISNANRVRCVR